MWFPSQFIIKGNASQSEHDLRYRPYEPFIWRIAKNCAAAGQDDCQLKRNQKQKANYVHGT